MGNQFRDKPDKELLERVFSAETAANYWARAAILRRGSTDDYDAWLVELLTEQVAVRDCPWNQELLERYLAELPLHYRRILVAKYPLSPSDSLLPAIEDALEIGYPAALRALSRIQSREREEVFRRWAATQEVDSSQFIESIRHLASWPTKALIVLRTSWSGLSQTQRSAALTNIALGLEPDGVGADEILTWLTEGIDQEIREGPTYLYGSRLAILGRFLEAPRSRAGSLPLLKRLLSSHLAGGVDGSDLFYAVRLQRLAGLCSFLMEELEATHLEFVLGSFRSVAYSSLQLAEEIARPYLEGPDSTLRRGLIVILARRHSSLGRAHLDEVFAPGAPRRTFFHHSTEYRDSVAGKRYQEITGHGYVEFRKSWPPRVTAASGREGELDLWPDFLKSYPAFPGIDDAYFRYAYALLEDGRLAAAVEAVDELFETERPDYDAAGYLLRIAKECRDRGVTSPRFERYLLARDRLLANPPATFLLDTGKPPAGLRSDLLFLRDEPGLQAFLGVSADELSVMEQLLDLTGRRPALGDRLDEARTLLNRGGGSLARLLYGYFFPPEYGEEEARARSRETIQRVSSKLATRVVDEARGNVILCGALARWIRWHAARSRSDATLYHRMDFQLLRVYEELRDSVDDKCSETR